MKLALTLALTGAALAAPLTAQGVASGPVAEPDQALLLRAAEAASAVLHLASNGRTDEARAMAAEAAALLSNYAGAGRSPSIRHGHADPLLALTATQVPAQFDAELETLADLGYLDRGGVSTAAAPVAVAEPSCAGAGTCTNAPECTDVVAVVPTPPTPPAAPAAPAPADAAVAPARALPPGAAVAQPFPAAAHAGQGHGAASVLTRRYASREDELLALLAKMEAEVHDLRSELTALRAATRGAR